MTWPVFADDARLFGTTTVAQSLLRDPASLDIEHVSATLAKGTRGTYRRRPTGDGPGSAVDERPIYNESQQDCTTYVEATLALVGATDLASFRARLLALKYLDDKPSFSTRTHWPETEWLPNALGKNFLVEITEYVFDGKAPVAKGQVFPREFRRGGGDLTDDVEARPERVSSSIRYLPVARLSDAETVKRIPSGTVFSTVRRALKIGRSDLLVSHQGFLIWITNADGTTALIARHASPRAGRVIDEPIAIFARRLSAAPSVLGVNLLSPH